MLTTDESTCHYHDNDCHYCTYFYTITDVEMYSQFHDEDDLLLRLEHLVQPNHSAAAPSLVHGGHLVHYLPARVHSQPGPAAELGREVVPRAQLQTLVDAGPLASAGQRRELNSKHLYKMAQNR